MPQRQVNNDLLQEVKDFGGTLSYVAVSGIVTADNKNITGLYNNEVKGVIQKISIKEHKSEWKAASKNWYVSFIYCGRVVKQKFRVRSLTWASVLR